jgi:FkbM family methyltransferase
MQFSNSVIQGITAQRRERVVGPAIDTYRFPPPIVFGCDDPERALALVEFVANHATLFDRAAASFDDPASREWLRALYVFMALGPHHVRLPTNQPAYWAHYEQAARLRTGASGVWFGDTELDLFALDYLGERIELACRVGHVAFSFLRGQYMFDRLGVRIAPAAGDVVIDAGACLGDTALAFAAAVGPAGRVLSFDPMPSHAQIFQANVARNPKLAGRIALIEAAIGTVTGEMVSFEDRGAASRPSETGQVQATTLAIDDVVRAERLDRVDFIKMDIEGGELEALAGAMDTIRRFKPKLAISAYHKIDDLLMLPAAIRAIEPGYRLYLDHYTVHQEETVIFATPCER